MSFGGLNSRLLDLSGKGVWAAAVGVAAALNALVCGAGVLVERTGVNLGGPLAILLAGAVCVLAAAAGLWPLRIWGDQQADRFAQAALAGSPIRMISVLLLGGLTLIALPSAARVAFVLWVAVCYLLSLAGETVVIALWLWAKSKASRA